MALDELRFRQVVVEALRIADKTYRPELKLGDLDEWDSVAHLELVSAIEQAFRVRFTADEIVQLTSLKELRDRIASQTPP